MIKLVRVDHRLLHGQVAFNWTSHLSADCILLVSDNLLNDSIRLSAVKLSKPSGVRLVIQDVDKAIKSINSGKTDKLNLFIVCETVDEAIKLAREVDFKEVNLGGTLPGEGKEKLERTLYVTNQEKESLKKLADEGFYIYYQMIPSEQKKEINDLI